MPVGFKKPRSEESSTRTSKREELIKVIDRVEESTKRAARITRITSRITHGSASAIHRILDNNRDKAEKFLSKQNVDTIIKTLGKIEEYTKKAAEVAESTSKGVSSAASQIRQILRPLESDQTIDKPKIIRVAETVEESVQRTAEATQVTNVGVKAAASLIRTTLNLRAAGGVLSKAEINAINNAINTIESGTQVATDAVTAANKGVHSAADFVRREVGEEDSADQAKAA